MSRLTVIAGGRAHPATGAPGGPGGSGDGCARGIGEAADVRGGAGHAPGGGGAVHMPGTGPGGARSTTGLAPAVPHLRLTARGRALVVALAVVLGGTLGFVAGRADAAAEPAAAVQVVVEPGDTLWSLAGGLAAPGEDVRDVVIEVQRLNRMPTASLQAGQILLLPGDRVDGRAAHAAD